jgi:hypothetical protein
VNLQLPETELQFITHQRQQMPKPLLIHLQVPAPADMGAGFWRVMYVFEWSTLGFRDTFRLEFYEKWCN